MVPLKLRIKNFLCYRDNVPELDLQGLGVVCLCGDNGHGKSALLDAMTWALWGCARGIRFGTAQHPLEELVHQGQVEMSVELEFQAGGNRYLALRRHTRRSGGRSGATILDLQVSTGISYRSIAGNSVQETEEKVGRLLGMDYKTFINSAFLLQGRADEFTKAEPAERKEVLARILDLGLYERLAERARQQARQGEQEARLLEAELARADEALSHRSEHQQALDAARQELVSLAPQVEAAHQGILDLRVRLGTLERREADLQQLDKAIGDRLQGLQGLERQIAAKEARIAELTGQARRGAEVEASESAIERLEHQVEEERGALQALHAGIGHREAEGKRLEKERKDLLQRYEMLKVSQDPRCPLCGTLLGQEGRQHLEQEIESQGKETRRQLDETAAALASLRAQETRAAGALRALEADLRRQRAETEARRARVQEAQKRLPHEQEEMDGLRALAARHRAEVAESQGRRETLARELVELPQLRRQTGEAEVVYRGLEERQRRLLAHQEAAGQRLAQLAEMETQRGQQAARREAVLREQATHDLLAEAFGRRGVQAMLLDAALPELEQRANELLHRLSDGRMTVALSTQRQTRQGKVVETLDIKVADELGTRSYEMFSGGEAFRVNFALRVALAGLLAARAGAPLRTLFVDEGFGTQDAAGRGRLVEAVQAIQNDFDLIVVITHIEELKEVFPTRIEVTKGPLGSTFQTVLG